MKKKLKGGKIAVLYSSDWGAGWYSWHGIRPLLFDPTVVEMVENNEPTEKIKQYCRDTYGTNNCYDGADSLDVAYVDTDERFYIKEYDGLESVVLESNFNWISAV